MRRNNGGYSRNARVLFLLGLMWLPVPQLKHTRVDHSTGSASSTNARKHTRTIVITKFDQHGRGVPRAEVHFVSRWLRRHPFLRLVSKPLERYELADIRPPARTTLKAGGHDGERGGDSTRQARPKCAKRSAQQQRSHVSEDPHRTEQCGDCPTRAVF